MRALLALALLLVACSLDRSEPPDPVDFAFLSAPADFEGTAPCAAARGCICCCFKVACGSSDAVLCASPGELDSDPAYAMACAGCLAGDLDAGAGCAPPPQALVDASGG